MSSEVKPVVDAAVANCLNQWFEETPADARKVISKAHEAAAAREAARKARDHPPQGGMEIASLPGKLADCQNVIRQVEIFLVEVIGGRCQGATAPIRPFCRCAARS